MPDVSGPINVAPSTNIGQYWGGSPDATTDPNNNIQYDPNHLGAMTQNSIEDTLAHELTHVRQNQNTPWYQRMYNQVMGDPMAQPPAGLPSTSTMSNPYYWQPNEMEALQTERDRMFNQNRPYPVDPGTGQTDMYLPPEKKQKGINTAPSTNRGQ